MVKHEDDKCRGQGEDAGKPGIIVKRYSNQPSQFAWNCSSFSTKNPTFRDTPQFFSPGQIGKVNLIKDIKRKKDESTKIERRKNKTHTHTQFKKGRERKKEMTEKLPKR